MKRLLLIIACLPWAVTLWANPVTADQARQKAAQFLGERVARARGSAPVTIDLNLSAVGREDSYFIFNAGNNEGFVVVSGEDATEEILGYSDTGSIDSESMPCNMQMLFDMYAEQIQYVRENGLKREDVARGRRMTSDGYPQSYTIAESRRSRFDQFEPYNDLCPVEDAPSGCVATAMAGLMYAYQWPHATIAKIPSYWDGPFTYINGSPENTAIEWANILPQYGYWDQVAQPVSPYYIPYDNIPEASKNAIATLMRIAGTSVETSYDDDGSGADVPDVPSALTKYFNYDGSVVFAYRKDNANNWKSALKNELLYHGPVIYRGEDSEGDGHAFLIEGWENDKFIINFGWSGDGNGKFLLEVAETDGQIISYLNEQGAVFNVKPRGDDQIEVAHLDLLNADIDNHTISGEYLSGRMSLHNLKDYSTRAFTLSLMDQETGATKHITPNKSIPPDGIYRFDFRFTKLLIGHHYVLTANYYNGVPFFTSVELTCMEEPTFDPDDVIPGNDDLVAYEYWFDDDVDNRKTVGMNSNAAVIRAAIDTRSLSGGLHWFNFRLKRADGKYSPVSSSPFMNLKERKEGRIEYWFDDDFSNSGSMSIADTEDEQEVALDMSDISKFPLGLHTLNMRVATEGKSLGNIYTTRVLKTASGDFDRMEYWVDDNFSSSDGRSYVTGRASEDQSFIFNQPFNLAGVPSGPHRLYYRAVSAKGTTSSAVSMTPIIVGGGTPAKIEYWFDGDATKSATVDLPAAALQDTVNVALLMGDIQKFPLGMHQLSMRLVTGSREQSPLYTARVLKMATGKADRIEYWVDDDREHLGYVSGKAASGDDHCYIFTDPFDLSGVSPGLHCIYYRAASSDGIVSSAVSMTPVLVGGGSTAKLEYWFDDDYEGDEVQTLDGTFNEGEGVVYFDEAVNLDYLSTGVHRLYYRGVNADGVTRTAVSMTPVLVKSMFKPDASGAKILGYSISVDGKEAKTREFTSPRSELVMEHVLDARDLTTGTHRVKAKIWNSAYAGVSVEQQFSVLAPTVPTLTLAAEEHDGLVSLRFDAVPNDLRYRTVRVDANGAKAKVDGKEGSSYPGTVAYTDNPAAGTYTYYVQTAYTDYLGEQHSLKSNEVTVTVAESPAQEVVAEEFGYITGRIVCDKNTPTYGLKVHFSDGVTTNVVTTAFARTRIPVGTVLTLTVTGDDTHEYEPATVTVAAGANNVTLQGTLIEENHVSNLQNDLAVCSPLKLTVMDGRHHVKFSVKNLSHENDWQGTISLKAIDKKKADKNGLDVATMGYEEKNLYVGESFSLEIGYNATKEVDIFIKGLKLKQDTEFYLYLESTGSFLTSNLSPLTSHLTKPLAVVSSAELAENPAVVTIGRTDGEPAGWNKDYAERFAYLMLGVSSLLDGVSGPAGDLSLFYDIGLAMAKEITGKRNAKEAISDWLTWLSGKPVVEVIDNPTISNAISAIYGIYTTIGPTYAQKYWKDILGASWDYASAQLMMGNLITIGQAVTTDDPIEATLLCSSMVYSLFYSGTAAPYASMMYSYMVVGQSLVNKVLQFASIMRGRYIVTRLKANKPYSGSDEGRQNTAVDFKLVVKTKNLIGSSKIDFTKAAASRQVKSISVKVAHQKGLQQAEFSFSPVFLDDGIMLKTDGNGITNSQSLDDQNEISEFYMEINWANGRQTLIPLNEEADGIDISFKGTDPQGIDHFEDFKPLVYTVTLTTATGKDNIPDELYLGSNKKRQ